jgi:hypothetical protein
MESLSDCMWVDGFVQDSGRVQPSWKTTRVALRKGNHVMTRMGLPLCPHTGERCLINGYYTSMAVDTK